MILPRGIGTGIDEPPRDHIVAAGCRDHERRVATLVGLVNVDPPATCQQQIDTSIVSLRVASVSAVNP